MSDISVPSKSKNRKHIATAAIMIAAVGAIVFGIYSGEADEVFQKAINICLECIGLG